MARPVSTKTLALRALDDPAVGNPTKLVALQAARAHLSFKEYGRHLRQLAAVVRGRTLRLCLLALRDHEAQERTHTQTKASASQREEIDAILAECAREQGIEQGGSKAIPESVEPVIVEPPPAAPNVPVDEVSSDAGSRSRDMRVQFQSEPPAVRLPDSDTGREELLAQGRALAASVLIQYERFTRCPHNLQECKRLDYLQGQFLKWEREAQLKFPGIELSEFANPRLRPAPPKVDFSRLDRQLMVPEMLMIPRVQPQARGPRDDGSMWAAAGPGI